MLKIILLNPSMFFYIGSVPAVWAEVCALKPIPVADKVWNDLRASRSPAGPGGGLGEEAEALDGRQQLLLLGHLEHAKNGSLLQPVLTNSKSGMQDQASNPESWLVSSQIALQRVKARGSGPFVQIQNSSSCCMQVPHNMQDSIYVSLTSKTKWFVHLATSCPGAESGRSKPRSPHQ